jgi:D-alanyl-lipoteichoic acid acyltransferase DltB (MBOAT superfamily)
MVVFLLSGFWHGAAWHFVVWGLLHGVAMCLERCAKARGLSLPRWCGRGLTLVFVAAAWVFFRAKTVGDAMTLLLTMVTKWQGGIDLQWWAVLYGVAVILLMVYLDREEHEPSAVENMVLYFLILGGWLHLLARTGGNTFLYFQF